MAEDLWGKAKHDLYSPAEGTPIDPVVWEQGGNKKGGLNFYIHNGDLYINGWADSKTDNFEPYWEQGGEDVNWTVAPNTAYVASLVMDATADPNLFYGFVNGEPAGVPHTPCLGLPTHGDDCAFGHNEHRSRFISGSNRSLADFSGLIAEFYSYNAVLTEEDREGLECFLMDKYGVAVCP